MNESIAPNAYILPRKSASPGMIVTIAIRPKTMIAMYGVRNLGCSWRSFSGSWRCWPIE